MTAKAELASSAWKQALANAIRDPDQLIDRLELDDRFREGARRAAQLFPLVVPLDFIARMRKGDPDDPLLRQVLPLDLEAKTVEGFDEDPLEESARTIAPGLLHKYAGRVLLVATAACAINCRYCFRRHFPYDQVPRGLATWEPALSAIRADTGIREVILSGGDPLLLTDSLLGRLIDRLEEIPHLDRLRIHSRLPIVLPNRITPGLIERLRACRLTPILVVHSNHAAELVGNCARTLEACVSSGIPLLNQTVLLRGVNDDLDALHDLCERAVNLRVLPYYLHQLDRVAGTAHFYVSESRGLELVEKLRKRLPGYAMPTYVREVPGAESKLVLRPRT